MWVGHRVRSTAKGAAYAIAPHRPVPPPPPVFTQPFCLAPTCRLNRTLTCQPHDTSPLADASPLHPTYRQTPAHPSLPATAKPPLDHTCRSPNPITRSRLNHPCTLSPSFPCAPTLPRINSNSLFVLPHAPLHTLYPPPAGPCSHPGITAQNPALTSAAHPVPTPSPPSRCLHAKSVLCSPADCFRLPLCRSEGTPTCTSRVQCGTIAHVLRLLARSPQPLNPIPWPPTCISTCALMMLSSGSVRLPPVCRCRISSSWLAADSATAVRRDCSAAAPGAQRSAWREVTAASCRRSDARERRSPPLPVVTRVRYLHVSARLSSRHAVQGQGDRAAGVRGGGHERKGSGAQRPAQAPGNVLAATPHAPMLSDRAWHAMPELPRNRPRPNTGKPVRLCSTPGALPHLATPYHTWPHPTTPGHTLPHLASSADACCPASASSSRR